ncbi:MAG: ABC transporter permease subunit [Burkholderiales bacterium]
MNDKLTSAFSAINEFSETSAPIDFMLILRHWDVFLQGLANSFTLVSLSFVIAAMFALPMAVLKWRKVPIAKDLVSVYVYIFRGTPLLVQAYLIYYGLAQFQSIKESFFWTLLVDPWWCVLIALTINSTAYQIDIYRGGLDAVPYGEVEAAKAIGLSRFAALRHIVIPSALRRCFPMTGNEMIFLLHGSAIASTLTITDILGAGRQLNSEFYLAYEGFLAATLIYMTVIISLTRFLNIIEKRIMGHVQLTSPTPSALP